ncbi:MAG: hypothetical protein E7485_06465 [Ruminococcaceae bacterium]|nr:hypothetical protein [Oscillospiraceae bacterium]
MDEVTAVDTSTVMDKVTAGLEGGFTMGTKAFNFLMDNPLTSFIIGIGFCYTALGIIRRALRVSKRM